MSSIETLQKLQQELDNSIANIKQGKYSIAKNIIRKSIDLTDCSVCKLELGLVHADVTHTDSICELGSETCKEETEFLIEKIEGLKNDFKEAEQY